jgi:hypothetical protein
MVKHNIDVLRRYQRRFKDRKLYTPRWDRIGQRIYNNFVYPIFKVFTETIHDSMDTILEGTFHANTRTIKIYHVKRPFWLNGSYAEAPLQPIPNYKRIRIEEGQKLFVRFDSTKPTFVDVEHDQNPDAFYVIPRITFKNLEENLKEVDIRVRKTKRRRKSK